MQVPVFLTSVDLTGDYPLGICGEIQIVLHEDTPQFISKATDLVDAAVNPWYIVYNKLFARVYDNGRHTVKYQLASKEYSGLIMSFEDTLVFEVTCPLQSILVK